MVGNVPFLMKDVVLLAASVYLLKQDVLRCRPLVADMVMGLMQRLVGSKILPANACFDDA
jgi:hypothetical protein